MAEKFAFRSHLTRETSFSIDYDELYQLIHHEKAHGFIVWVLGPRSSLTGMPETPLSP